MRYTPAAGWTGADAFVFDASDELDTSAPARARITVTLPHRRDDDEDEPRGPGRGQLPSDCVVLPGTSWCHVPVRCGGGGDMSGCTGRWMQAPARARRGLAVAARARTPLLLKPVKLRIPAGKTRKLKLQLTKAGKAQLRKRGRVAVTVVGEIRAEGRVIKTTRQRFVFKRRR